MEWRKIPNYPNYMLSEKGDLYNITNDSFLKGTINPSGVKYVALSKDNEHVQIQLAQLVLNVFKPSKTETKVHAWHNDLELEHCANNNLKRCTLSDRMRMFNEIKGKKRGISKWKRFSIRENKIVTKYRALFKNKQGKIVTVGYYKTKIFAELRYIQAYKKEFGRLPY